MMREHLRSRTISTAKVRQKRQPVITQIAVELSQMEEDDDYPSFHPVIRGVFTPTTSKRYRSVA